MPVSIEKPFITSRPLSREIDKLTLLRQSNVDFVPIGQGKTIRTRPLLEDSNIGWHERFVDAALIYLTNPLCYAAQSLVNDEVADGRTIVEEHVVGNRWKEHTNNPLAEWIGQPNPTMDIKEFLRAYATHLHIFGLVYAFMFQKGDIFPNGKINRETNCFDLIFPGRVAQDWVSNPFEADWYYQPLGYEDLPPLKLSSTSLYVDVLYNPISYSIGVSLPNNPLNKIFKIHKIYLDQLERFFTEGAHPTHLLTRVVDLTKDSVAASITDDQIEEAVQRVYAKIGRSGIRPGGWLGLRGDWRVNKIGSALPELMNPDLLLYLESLVTAVWKIPPSLFWVGLKSGGQRASRQQDAIDFYNQKIKPLQERMNQRLWKFLIPKFIPNTKSKFRVWTDTSEMALAQYARSKDFRQYERWYQLNVITRGKFLEFVNEDSSDLTAEERDQFYSETQPQMGGASTNLSVGTGEQSIEKENALE